LREAQGMYLTDNWYWDLWPESRAWARKFFDKFKRMPSSLHAADYSAARFYLGAVKATGTDDGEKVIQQMHKTKINDMYAKGGYVRQDGRMVHDMFVMQVKTPQQSTTPWDYYKLVAVAKGDDVFTNKAESKCPLWK